MKVRVSVILFTLGLMSNLYCQRNYEVTVGYILNGYLKLRYQVINPDGTPASREFTLRPYKDNEINQPLHNIQGQFQSLRFIDANGVTHTYTPSAGIIQADIRQLILGIDKGFGQPTFKFAQRSLRVNEGAKEPLKNIPSDSVLVEIMNLRNFFEPYALKNPDGSIDAEYINSLLSVKSLDTQTIVVKKIDGKYQTILLKAESRNRPTEANTFEYEYTPTGREKRLRFIIYEDRSISRVGSSSKNDVLIV